eukprot:CAMPEP_0176040992 /NCGR_PEP_ID=MMETSP0120_2-20121206/20331_1 /TAXON_ID=160619 /ORGANISM="Kryptoperidinium foliaceum, Strain CCMP 1326" /LENGTH=793 /DNA_ID=CAMNT_0017374395 /DNA_START=47 /DNA_END=2426 /DNA_ORIENTATION=-
MASAFEVEPGSAEAKPRQVGPFGGNGLQKMPSTVLEPFETGRRVLETVNPVRAVLLLGLVACVAFGTVSIDKETFTAWGRLTAPDGTPDWGYTLQDCRDLCANSTTTKGFCEEVDGQEPKYRLEYQEKKYWYMREAEEMPDILADRGYCQLKHNVPRWKSLAAIAVFSFAIALVIQGAQGEVVLLGGAAVLAALGVVSNESVYSGLASAGVVGLALLFPIASSISETGVLSAIMDYFLGSPSTLTPALVRLSVSVTLMSAFLSNTATVALMIPVVMSWSRRINIHPGKLMMPLSFVAQLGGSITQVGSSHCVVAADVSKARYNNGEGPMGIFDLSATAILVALGTGASIVLLAGTSLLASSAEADDGAGASEAVAIDDMRTGYWVRFWIMHRGPLDGQDLGRLGLRRLPGVLHAKVSGAQTGDQGNGSAPRVNADFMQYGESVEFLCEPAGLISLRQVGGWAIDCEEALHRLGARRRGRFLYEAVVRADSDFLTTDVLDDPGRLLREYGAVLVAGPRVLVTSKEHPTTVPVKAGGVALQAFEDWVSVKAANRWRRACSLVTKIPDSSPKRFGGPVDCLRNAAVCIGMVLMILSLALPYKFLAHLELYISASVLVLFYLLIRAISVEKMLSAIKIDILLIIAGAIALGDALTTTGVVAWVASTVLQFAKGKVAVYSMVYLVAVVLGAFVNNSAVVAILAPMLESICDEDPNMSFNGLVWLLTLASGTCFITPLGYQTNLMVMPGGRHTFGDYVKFGSVNQLVHMVFSVLCVLMLQPPSAAVAVVADTASVAGTV